MNKDSGSGVARRIINLHQGPSPIYFLSFVTFVYCYFGGCAFPYIVAYHLTPGAVGHEEALGHLLLAATHAQVGEWLSLDSSASGDTVIQV